MKRSKKTIIKMENKNY